MNRFIDILMNADDAHPFFIGEDGDPITASAIRNAAAAVLPAVSARRGRLYLHTRSAALMCAGAIAASASGRPLVLLPQGGVDYRAEVGVSDADYLSDEEDGGISLSIHDNPPSAFKANDDVQLIFYTSGSSGGPKAVERSGEVVAAEARMWANWFDGRISHIAGTVSHQHIYGVIFRVFLPVLAGITSSDIASLSWEALSVQIRPNTLVASSPAHLTRLPEAEAGPALTPKLVISSGGPLPWSAAQKATELFGSAPMEILGSTETGGVARRERISEDEPWTVLDSVEATLGSEGVLQVSSPFTGADGVVEMGDRAEFLEDGRFRLGGRVDRILKVEGKRVSLARVEGVFKGLDAVEDIVLLPTQQGHRERLSAIVVLSDEAKRELGEEGAFAFSRRLIGFTGDALAPAERPKRWRFVPDIPVNSQGKRVQQELQKLFIGARMMDLLKPDQLEISGDKARISFEVGRELPWFEGHFKNQPVLPGLSQVHMAVRLAEEIWSAAPRSYNISRMKFQQVVRPGDHVTIELNFNFELRRLTYAMTNKEVKYSGAVIG